jgi:bifunctional oligoribonuclease and PAP phosphatase NrnA
MFRKIKHIIDKGKRFLITTHIDPDGDAIGSAFSMYWALESLNKTPVIILKDPVPYRYEFLPQPTRIIYELIDDPYDAIFVLDCGNFFRIGDGYEKLQKMGPIINIDHHSTNETFGLINIIDESASSTAEILYRLFKTLKLKITYDIAINIYTAIFTDTGSFRYDSTNSNAFFICEKMTTFGVKPSYVSQMVHENHPKERFLLLGLVFATLKMYDQGRIAIVHVTEKMFKKTHTTREHTDGFVEYIREIKGVEVAILAREINRKKYKISMRSKGTVDVASICNLFGGGGHKNAAGCQIDGDMEEVINKLRKAFHIQ